MLHDKCEDLTKDGTKQDLFVGIFVRFQASAFLRAVYEGKMDVVMKMMEEDGVPVDVQNQVRALCSFLVSCFRSCVIPEPTIDADIVFQPARRVALVLPLIAVFQTFCGNLHVPLTAVLFFPDWSPGASFRSETKQRRVGR